MQLIRKLIAWLRRWWSGPKKLKRFNAEVVDMSNVKLTWTLPTPTPRQRPLAHVRVDARVSDTLPWTEIGIVPVPGAELVVQDAAPGEWFYRATVVDDRGAESAPAFASAAVGFDGPTALADFGAVVE